MPTFEQLQAISSGTSITATTPNMGAQTIVVQNTNDMTGSGCLPCDNNSSCEILPTRAVVLDNNAFKNAGALKNRFQISNTGLEATAKTIVFLSNYGQFSSEGQFNYPKLKTIINPTGALAANNLAGSAGLVINGNALFPGQEISQVNMLGAGGSVIAEMKINFDNTLQGNASLQNFIATQFVADIFANHSVVTSYEYSPFCDCCFNSNNGNRSTFCFTQNIPVTFRSGVAITVPLGAVFTLEICYGEINLANTMGATPQSQTV